MIPVYNLTKYYIRYIFLLHPLPFSQIKTSIRMENLKLLLRNYNISKSLYMNEEKTQKELKEAKGTGLN
jgi:hypothetical protein